MAAWHRPSRRNLAEGGNGGTIGQTAFLPLPRPLLYEAWIGWNRPAVERWTGPVDAVWASAMVPVASAAPLVATVHDLDFLANPDHLTRRGRSFFPRALEAVAARADRVVCPSEVVATDCERYGIDRSRLRVVPWGVDPPASVPADVDVVRARWDLPDRFVLFVGTVEPRKNLDGLVAAVAGLPGLPLVLVGPAGWKVDGRDLVAPLGERAIRIGSVGAVELSALYRAASVVALPSLAEGFGLPVLEAMAHGTPVVTSAGTATEEVAGGAAVLVDPGDPDAIRAGLELALDRGSATMRRVEEGRERAGRLSWDATAASYARVFAEVRPPRHNGG